MTRGRTVGYCALGIGTLVVAILVYFYQPNLQFLSEPSWLSVVAALVLAFLTAIYVLQTQGMLKEMAMARKAEALPHVKANLQYPGPLVVDLLLKNVGKGPAMNVDVAFGFQPSDEPFKHWLHPLLAPEESYSFLIEPSNFNELVQKYDFLLVRGTCEDAFGERHKIDEKIDLKEIHKGWSQAMILMRPSIRDKLKEISDELRRLGYEIRDTTRYQRTFPVYMRLGKLEISQPPLQTVDIAVGTLYFSGKSLDDGVNAQLKKLKEGDLEQVYCTDRHGKILSGICQITKIELKEESVGQKVMYSFRGHLEYKN